MPPLRSKRLFAPASEKRRIGSCPEIHIQVIFLLPLSSAGTAKPPEHPEHPEQKGAFAPKSLLFAAPSVANAPQKAGFAGASIPR
jgi:hypothetical protein